MYLQDVVPLTNVDIASSNLTVLNNYTLDQCKTACANTTNCAAFSISCSDGDLCGVKRNGVDPTYQCALKGALGASDIHIYPTLTEMFFLNGHTPLIGGLDFYQSDLFQLTTTVGTCIKTCLQTAGCGVLMFDRTNQITVSSSQMCWLKKSITNFGWNFSVGWQSYVMPKTTVSGSSLMTQCFPLVYFCPPGEYYDEASYTCYTCPSGILLLRLVLH